MVEEHHTRKEIDEDAVLDQQFLRALSSFEGIILSQIYIKNKLGNRLNYSIQAGLIMVGGVATMRENVRQIAQPMGSISPFVP